MSPDAPGTLARRLPARDELLRALGFVLLVNLAGGLPALLGGPGSAWFRTLEKPAFYPPPATFGLVWTTVFTLLGIALFLVVRQGVGHRRVRVALGLFALQMALNVAWTPTFFRFRSIAGGLAVIVALWLALVPTAWAFARVDRRAGALLVPYLAWVAFAALLNYRILALN